MHANDLKITVSMQYKDILNSEHRFYLLRIIDTISHVDKTVKNINIQNRHYTENTSDVPISVN